METPNYFLAGEFYENDFSWDDIRALRQPVWEAKPVVVVVAGDACASAEVEGSHARVWDHLYTIRGEGMFKTRRYIIKAFPELAGAFMTSPPRVKLVDLGCGAGASLLPILAYCQPDQLLSVFASDISPEAVELLDRRIKATGKRNVDVCLEVWDLTLPPPPSGLSFQGDFGLLIFTLSAIHPDQQVQALRNCGTTLKSGGRLLIRDYGAFDMIQHRCPTRTGEWTVRKEDGVLCTFYTIASLTELLERAGFAVEEPARYCTVRNLNRKQNSEMLRVFIRAVGLKP